MNEIVWAIDPHHTNINIGSDGQKFYHNVKNSKRITEMRKIHATPQRVMILAESRHQGSHQDPSLRSGFLSLRETKEGQCLSRSWHHGLQR